LHGGAHSINAAYEIKQSDAADFFQSKTHEKHRAWIESNVKIDVAVVDRLNSVIRGIGILAKRI
jgi:hypothetical protein